MHEFEEDEQNAAQYNSDLRLVNRLLSIEIGLSDPEIDFIEVLATEVLDMGMVLKEPDRRKASSIKARLCDEY